MDHEILEHIAFGTARLASAGIGSAIGIMLYRMPNYVKEKIQDRNWTKAVIEGWGKYYEGNLPKLAVLEVEKERGLKPSVSIFYDPEYLNRYTKKHPEKKEQWKIDLDILKAVYRARLDRNLPFIETPQPSGFLE